MAFTARAFASGDFALEDFTETDLAADACFFVAGFTVVFLEDFLFAPTVVRGVERTVVFFAGFLTMIILSLNSNAHYHTPHDSAAFF
ncbi:MAG: hypothetical protein LBS40_06595 [Burkholderiales bacterium]|nr:hypothetical protein [Burkholderiales bacterium]